MARRSLRPQLNQIRNWVRQGRTDAWVAHQLEVTVKEIQEFKRENGLLADGEAPDAGAGRDFDDEIDLRAEDDALIAAELEAAEAKRAEEEEAAEETEPEAEHGMEESYRDRPNVRRLQSRRGRDDFDDIFADEPPRSSSRPTRVLRPVGNGRAGVQVPGIGGLDVSSRSRCDGSWAAWTRSSGPR